MVPYQIYQALSQQRGHELENTARRHERMHAARLATASPSEPWSRVKGAVAQLTALVHPWTRTAPSRPTTSAPRATSTAGSTAGPMGCVA